MTNAFWYARRLEQAHPLVKKLQPFSGNYKTQKIWNKDSKEKDNVQNNIVELKATGKCFKCKELWVPGHAKVCKGKQFFLVVTVEKNRQEEMSIVEDENTTDQGEYHDAKPVPTLQISMHALTSISSQEKTFTLRLKFGNTYDTALVDSGSDVSFINTKFAMRSNLPISQIEEVKVAAANGTEMHSSTSCTTCSYLIQGHSFISDFRLLEVQGFDVVLGADWIYQHSLVGIDLKGREFSITKDAKSIITFSDKTITDGCQLISTRKLCHLLKKKAVGAVIVLNNNQNSSLQPPSKISEHIQSILNEF